jgi:phospholipase C
MSLHIRSRLQCSTAMGTAIGVLMCCGLAWADDAHNVKTQTPIKHLIVLIGENRSFDHVYATYRPKNGMVANLLSKGIVSSSGVLQAGTQSLQYYLSSWPATYFIDASTSPSKMPYTTVPPPNTAYVPPSGGALSQGQGPFNSTVPDSELPTIEPSIESEDLGLLRTGASGYPMDSTDLRVTNATSLPNGSFQITNSTTLPYDSYTGDMVHRLFHMWQQSDCNVAKNATAANPSGCLNDLYPFVGVARDDGSGGNSMGFLNVQNGDAPLLKSLADQYTLNDNYHQPVMGGTAVQHMMMMTGDAIPWETFQGVTQPPAGSVANPNPKSSTNVAFTADEAWTSCSDPTQPGISPIVSYLATLPWKPASNCAPGRYYMINNLSPGYLPNGNVDATSIVAGNKVPPSSLRTIGDALNQKNISWAYYGGGFDAAVRVVNGSTNPVDGLIAQNYCDICNPFGYVTSIMGNATQRAAHIKDAIDFFNDIGKNQLPSIAFVKPDSLIDGHPASSKLDLFEAMLQKMLDALNGRPDLVHDTAFLVTVDEGGGYWDSGFFLPLDFFGDGPRIPLIVISPYSTGGNVVHSYNDHASIIKFIEHNWGLQPLTGRSRDNLPNPIMSKSQPYVPTNIPAIGDLFDMFNFN